MQKIETIYATINQIFDKINRKKEYNLIYFLNSIRVFYKG